MNDNRKLKIAMLGHSVRSGERASDRSIYGSVALFDAARLTNINPAETVSFNLRKARLVIYFCI